MIEKLIAASARNLFFVALGVLVIIGVGVYAVKKTPLDALPDLSDVQVIVFTEWPGRAPNLVEDQVSYPIVSTMLSAPKVKVVRGYSYFGMSFVYIIFQDGTDIYWARSRVLEYMNGLAGKLPSGVAPVHCATMRPWRSSRNAAGTAFTRNPSHAGVAALSIAIG